MAGRTIMAVFANDCRAHQAWLVPHKVVYPTSNKRKRVAPRLIAFEDKLQSLNLEVPPNVKVVAKGHELSWWVNYLSSNDPLLGEISDAGRREARRVSFFKTDGSREPGASLRSFALFVWESTRTEMERKDMFRRYLVELLRQQGTVPTVQPDSVLDAESELGPWNAWKETHGPGAQRVTLSAAAALQQCGSGGVFVSAHRTPPAEPGATEDVNALSEQLDNRLYIMEGPTTEPSTTSGPDEPDVQATQAARDAVQTLVAELKNADALGNSSDRACAASLARQKFLSTPYGKAAMHELTTDGLVKVPYFASQAEADENTAALLRIVQEGTMEGVGNTLDVSLTKEPRLKPIKGQTRYMLGAGCLGSEFVRITQEMAATVCAVARALVDGATPGVLAHKISALVNSLGTLEQVWHRDESGEDVEARMAGGGSGSRGRPQVPPFSVLSAIQARTLLHVVKGSHRRPLDGNFSGQPCVEYSIPTGWGCIFNGLTVHHGQASLNEAHARIHMYLTAIGCCPPPHGRIEVVSV